LRKSSKYQKARKGKLRKSADHKITQSQNHPITKSPDHKITKSPIFKICVHRRIHPRKSAGNCFRINLSTHKRINAETHKPIFNCMPSDLLKSFLKNLQKSAFDAVNP